VRTPGAIFIVSARNPQETNAAGVTGTDMIGLLLSECIYFATENGHLWDSRGRLLFATDIPFGHREHPDQPCRDRYVSRLKRSKLIRSAGGSKFFTQKPWRVVCGLGRRWR